MKLIETICMLKAAIDASAEQQSDLPWHTAVEKGGLVSQGDTGRSLKDEKFEKTFGSVLVTFHHLWKDTSRTMQIGPDRTRLTLTVSDNGHAVDSYCNGFDS